MTKSVIHYDKKILTPVDRFSSMTEDPRKTVRGYVVVSNDEGVKQGENLVLLGGREFIAQMITGFMSSDSDANDYRDYKIRYFGVGSGGAEDDDNGDPVVKVGPYANDTDLYEPQKIAENGDGDKYVDNGYLKKILVDDGKIEILKEDHEIVVDGETKTVSAYTTIKFTMYLTQDEPPSDNKPFEFNEAGLWAVEYDSDGNIVEDSDGNANKLLIAHFTTSSKYIEDNESLKIEWYILV